MEDKKFYWLKLKKDFFKRHDIRIIEGMPNGKEYIVLYMKLLCESIDHQGRLRFSDKIPYTPEMLSTITNTNVNIVNEAIEIFCELNLMEIDKDKTYIMCELDKMLGCETAWAEKKRRQREKKDMSEGGQCPPICPTDVLNVSYKSIDIEKEKEIDIDNNIICSQLNESVFELPLNDNTFYSITKDMITHYEELYPNVNVMQELRNILGWLESNPKKRKTRLGIARFINNWLAKEQDKGNNPNDNKRVIKNKTNDFTEEYINNLENNIKRL
jgi:predicted phage replisome organizer